MKNYNYFTIGNANEYGQATLSAEPVGSVKISISLTSQNTVDNIKYVNAAFLGLTHDKNINDTYVIEYGAQKLKVLYVNTIGRYTQVYMNQL